MLFYIFIFYVINYHNNQIFYFTFVYFYPVLTLFVQSNIKLIYHFQFLWNLLFCWEIMLGTNSITFCLLQKTFISSSCLSNNFTACRILLYFPCPIPTTSYNSFHALYPCIFSDEKSDVVLILIPLYVEAGNFFFQDFLFAFDFLEF